MPEPVRRYRRTIVCTGYSRLPQGMTAQEVYGTLGIGLEVDPQTGEVIDATITLVSEMGRRFFLELMTGRNLNEGIEPCVKDIEATYFGPGKKAIVFAVRDAYSRFLEFKEYSGRIQPSSE